MSEHASEHAPLRVVFMGTPALAVPTVRAVADEHDVVAVVTQPDRAAGRGRGLRMSPVKEWAVAADVVVMQPERVREGEAVEALRATEPDAIVVVAFGQILPAEILSIPRLGCINVHASLLPAYRGASPIQAALLAGDATTGVTTMLMDEGLDTGPILLQREEPVRADDTAGSLGPRLGDLGATLMVETLSGLRDGAIHPEPQNESAATITRLVRKIDGAIDWNAAAGSIERQVRAMQPWPVAFTEHDGEVLRVWRSSVLTDTPSAAAGTVVPGDGALVVACGTGALRIEELQAPGGRRLAAADFLRGRPIPVGSCVGATA